MGLNVSTAELMRWQSLGLVAAGTLTGLPKTLHSGPKSPAPAGPPTITPPSDWRVALDLPGLKLVSRSNAREYWRARYNRDQAEAAQVRLAWTGVNLRDWQPPLPIIITMLRMGGRPMDDDNLAGAFKAVRDALAALLGVDDGNPGVAWKCRQTASAEPGVRVTIRPKWTPPPG